MRACTSRRGGGSPAQPAGQTAPSCTRHTFTQRYTEIIHDTTRFSLELRKGYFDCPQRDCISKKNLDPDP
jgi:hypothetical protein